MPPAARSRALVAALLIAVVVATLPAPTSSASSASSASTVSTASTAPRVAARATGTVTGWDKAPASVRAGSTYAARVRVSGGSRPVRLQRRVGSEWRTVATARSSRTGLVLLRWKAPRAATRTALRVLAVRSGSRPTAVTPAKTVSVLRALVGSVLGALTSLLRGVLGLVNDVRARGYRCGGVSYPAVRSLTANSRLTSAANKFARLMAAEDFFAHESPDGSSPGDRITAEGYRWSAWGENIAGGQQTAADVVEAWLDSPTHCVNLMSPAYTEIGLGHVYDGDSTYGHYWVQDFATPR